MKLSASWLLIVFIVSATNAIPCEFSKSLNISHGERLANGSVLADDILYPLTLTFQHKMDGGVHLRGCPCKIRTCVRKCCPLGEAYIDDTDCEVSDDSKVNPFNPIVYDGNVQTKVVAYKHFAFLNNKPCESYVMNPFSGTEEATYDVFHLQKVRFYFIYSFSIV